MPNPFPIAITADDGITEVVGKARFTDPANQPGGSTATEELTGNVVNIADGVTAALTLDTKIAGATLLDLSTPTGPKFLTAGVYAVGVCVTPAALTAAGTFRVGLGGNGGASDISDATPAGTTATPIVTATIIVVAAAGDVFGIDCTNHDGAAARDFSILNAYVTKIS